MLDLFASIVIGVQKSLTQAKLPSIVVVLTRPIDVRPQQRLLVNCEITSLSTEYLEVTCAD
jgi:hypothetical protein